MKELSNKKRNRSSDMYKEAFISQARANGTKTTCVLNKDTYAEVSDAFGCLQRDEKWIVYETDERAIVCNEKEYESVEKAYSDLAKRIGFKYIVPSIDTLSSGKSTITAHESTRKNRRNNGFKSIRSVARIKGAVARVCLVPGSGTITINKQDLDDYFDFETLKCKARQPLVLTETHGQFDVIVICKGGGVTNQAGAIRNGIALALVKVDTSLRPILKRAGYLDHSPRMKERKK